MSLKFINSWLQLYLVLWCIFLWLAWIQALILFVCDIHIKHIRLYIWMFIYTEQNNYLIQWCQETYDLKKITFVNNANICVLRVKQPVMSAPSIQYIPRNMHTVLWCFALLWLCNRSWWIHMKYLSIFIRVALLALGQSLDCHSASEVSLVDMGKSVNV